MKHEPIRVVAAILRSDNGKILVGKRRKDDSSAGKWEFPGGKIHTGESDDEALRREILEELGIQLPTFSFFGEVLHHYPRYSVNIRFYLATIDEKISLQALSHDELQWIYPSESSQLDFLDANLPVLKKLQSKS